MNRPAPRCHQGTSQDRLGGGAGGGREEFSFVSLCLK